MAVRDGTWHGGRRGAGPVRGCLPGSGAPRGSFHRQRRPSSSRSCGHQLPVHLPDLNCPSLPLSTDLTQNVPETRAPCLHLCSPLVQEGDLGVLTLQVLTTQCRRQTCKQYQFSILQAPDVSFSRWFFHMCPRALALTASPARILVCPEASYPSFKMQFKCDLGPGSLP